jgi:long-subunit fatty acid transport protein
MDDLDDWGFQPFVGLTYRLSERALFGAVYRAEMELVLESDVKITDLGPISSMDGDWMAAYWSN